MVFYCSITNLKLQNNSPLYAYLYIYIYNTINKYILDELGYPDVYQAFSLFEICILQKHFTKTLPLIVSLQSCKINLMLIILDGRVFNSAGLLFYDISAWIDTQKCIHKKLPFFKVSSKPDPLV